VVLLALAGALAVLPAAASAFSMGPAWRDIPRTADTPYFAGVATDFSALAMKSSKDAFADQTQFRGRTYVEGGKLLVGNSAELFARVGISHLEIKNAFNYGEKADLAGNAPYYAVGTRIRLVGKPSVPYEDETDIPPSEQRLRIGAFLMASWDGRVAGTKSVRTETGSMKTVEIESGAMTSATVGITMETYLARAWHAYAVPAMTWSATRQRGTNVLANFTESTTYTTKMPTGGVVGVRYTSPLRDSMEAGIVTGLTVGFEAGIVGGPTGSVYVTQVY
jgi:hypothetical protein